MSHPLIGKQVSWFLRGGLGVGTKRTGEVIALIEAGERARKYLPEDCLNRDGNVISTRFAHQAVADHDRLMIRSGREYHAVPAERVAVVEGVEV